MLSLVVPFVGQLHCLFGFLQRFAAINRGLVGQVRIVVVVDKLPLEWVAELEGEIPWLCELEGFALVDNSVPGYVNALNLGIEHVGDGYFMICGVDDDVYLWSIYKVIGNMVNDDSVRPNLITGTVRFGEKVLKKSLKSFFSVGQRSLVSAHSVGTLFHVSVHAAIGKYDPRLFLAADQEFFYRYWLSYGRSNVMESHEVFGRFGQHGVSSKKRVEAVVDLIRFMFLHRAIALSPLFLVRVLCK